MHLCMIRYLYLQNVTIFDTLRHSLKEEVIFPLIYSFTLLNELASHSQYQLFADFDNIYWTCVINYYQISYIILISIILSLIKSFIFVSLTFYLKS